MDDIVPDVVDAVPAGDIQVTYDEGNTVKQGNELTPTQVKAQPSVTCEGGLAGESDLITLLMVDPDAPTRQDPKYREILHWAVVNIPGSDLSKGQSVAAYVGSGPPEGTGLHRYIFLLYRQTGKIEIDTPPIPNTVRAGRLNFNARDFAAKHGLGHPIAANYYQAQYDDWVPIRNKTMTG